MKKTTFASTGFELVTKRPRKREFLEEMNLVVPCPAMEEASHDMALFREFTQLDAGATRLPDERTLPTFEHGRAGCIWLL